MLGGVSGNAMELVLEIDAKDSPMVELNVLRSANREEYTRISFFKDRGFRIHRNLPKEGALLASGLPAVPPFGSPRPVPVMQSILSLDTSYSSTLPDALSRPPETAPDLSSKTTNRSDYASSSTRASSKSSPTTSSA